MYSAAPYLKALEEQEEDRQSLLRNPSVDLQSFAAYWALLKSFRRYYSKSENETFLEVGCGNGGTLLQLVSWGFSPSMLCGIDVLEDRVSEAKSRLPAAALYRADAQKMNFKTGEFKITFSNGLFIQIVDSKVRAKIAEEMIRVTAPGGLIFLSDWKFSKPGNKNYRGLTRKDILEFWKAGIETDFLGYERGALLPPLGRALSKHIPSIYFLVQKLLPLAAAQGVAILRKR